MPQYSENQKEAIQSRLQIQEVFRRQLNAAKTSESKASQQASKHTQLVLFCLFLQASPLSFFPLSERARFQIYNPRIWEE